MANIKSAKKRIDVTAVRTARNKAIKSKVKTAVKKVEAAIAANDKAAATAALNAALKDWLFKYPPPASKTNKFKIRYMVQTKSNPVEFLIFATRPEVVPDTYVTFLKNRIREDLGFDKIPVQLEFKASRQKWEDRQFD